MKPVTRRRLLLGVAIVAIGAAPIIVWTMMPSRPGITKANFDRIEIGMTFDEVKAIFGVRDSFSDPSFENWAQGEERIWINDDRSGASILFDGEGQVVAVSWGDSPDNIGQKILRLIHWPWW